MGDQDGESFFTRWARLKRQAGEAPRGSQSAESLDRADGVGDEAETAAVPERGSPGQDAYACGPGDGTPKDADFADVDFDALDHTSDYARFMQPHVPETIRQKALRKLWASDPVLSMPDELNDYMGDYTDAAVAAPGRLLTTAYKVGRGFLDDSEVAAWAQETASFARHRRFLTIAVITFAGVSLVGALTLGAVLSWALIRPVRKVDVALEHIAEGNFDTRVDVPNRDEFGNLTKNLNRTTEHLAHLYDDLHTLNANLQETIDAKVAELKRTSRLARYLSPGLAESIVAGERDVMLKSSRKFLTTVFTDIRGFTSATERMEPEELVTALNEYFSEITEIVFRHGGTLDKYVGDSVMVFFGDPLPQEDHAERALRMAIEILGRLRELEDHWFRIVDQRFETGIGIATGWVTVGDIGSPSRSDYTVIGNQVNLAARLADRAEAHQILVTDRTMTAVEHVAEGRLVDEITLQGVSRPIKIYEIVTPPR